MDSESVEPKRPRSFHGEVAAAVERFFTPRRQPATPRDLEWIERGSTRSLPGGLVASIWGDGRATVLLAHGWESRRTHWSAFVPPLLEAGFRVVSVDAPAHGDSAGEKANMVQYGRAICAAAHELGPLAGVMGHSFGAAGLSVALRDGLPATRAVFLSSPASIETLVLRWARHHGLTEEELPQFLELAAREVGVTIGTLHVAELVAELTQPALIIHDRQDEDIPFADGEEIARAWPDAQLLATDRYGHRRILLARPVVQAAVTFLRDGVGNS